MDDSTPPKGNSRSSDSSVKETVDSILISFILAFVVRGFLVEPFVIPTGSMAPTLLGAHIRYRCDDCGYGFDVNYSGRQDTDDVFIPSRASDDLPPDRNGHAQSKVYSIHCPNCGYKVPRRNAADPDNAATNPPVRYGDRILVLKYLYLLSQPARWDVVVFKAPVEPQKYDYQQNYIKRLVGKPGETIMILDGDIYVSRNSAPLATLTPDDFEVQTKPRVVQEALWRIVDDSDHHPRGLSRRLTNADGSPSTRVEPAWECPWKTADGQTGWDLSTPRVFQFDNQAARADLTFDAAANPTKHSLTDWLGYDTTKRQGADPADSYDWPRLEYKPDHNVSDVKLAFVYERESGDGPLRATLQKGDDSFIAEIGMQSVTLSRVSGGTTSAIGTAELPQHGSAPLRVEFTNVDHRVIVRINDRDLITTTPAQYRPDVSRFLVAYQSKTELSKARVSISAEKQQCRVSHLSLWRDIYYTNTTPNDEGARPLSWASPLGFPTGAFVTRASYSSLIQLGADEYFVCGDNSPISMDGRFWSDPIRLDHERLDVAAGRVPERFLLGKAFFVYWPAGYKPLDSAPAVIPNFGDVRFIH